MPEAEVSSLDRPVLARTAVERRYG